MLMLAFQPTIMYSYIYIWTYTYCCWYLNLCQTISDAITSHNIPTRIEYHLCGVHDSYDFIIRFDLKDKNLLCARLRVATNNNKHAVIERLCGFGVVVGWMLSMDMCPTTILTPYPSMHDILPLSCMWTPINYPIHPIYKYVRIMSFNHIYIYSPRSKAMPTPLFQFI